MQAWNSLTRQSDFSEVRAISLAGQIDADIAEKQLTKVFMAVYSPESITTESKGGH